MKQKRKREKLINIFGGPQNCYLCPEIIEEGQEYYYNLKAATHICFTCHLELDLEERIKAPKGSKANYKTIAGEATKSNSIC
jgi:hypothetical protein